MAWQPYRPPSVAASVCGVPASLSLPQWMIGEVCPTYGQKPLSLHVPDQGHAHQNHYRDVQP
jgi:hypothetical protein